MKSFLLAILAYTLHILYVYCFNTGQFGVVYKAYYTSEEHRIIEVAVKLLKGTLANVFVINVVYSVLGL